MDFLERAQLANDGDFKRRVEIAVIKAAISIMNEDDTTANHADRVAFARFALHYGDQAAHRMARGVVANVAITAESTDSDIEYTVNSMWDGYADAFVGVGL